VKAQERVYACIAKVISGEDAPCAVLGHGLTLSLFVAAITGQDPLAVWRTIGLPDYAVLDLARRELVQPFGTWKPT
jgi:broad specificity phosphatase PhoE